MAKKPTFNKKKLKKKPGSETAPPTKRQELNDHIVCMRNTVGQVKVQIINRINHQIVKYRKRKGNEKELAKAIRKADRLVEEIHALKKLGKDKASLYALRDPQEDTLEVILCNLEATPEDRALARISRHPLIQQQVKKYRTGNPNWDVQIPVLLSLTKRKKKAGTGQEESPNFITKSDSNIELKVKTEQDHEPLSDASDDSNAEASGSDDDDSLLENSSNENDSDSDEDEALGRYVKSPNEKIVAEINEKEDNLECSTSTNLLKKSIRQGESKFPAVIEKSEGTVKVKLLKDLKDIEDDPEDCLIKTSVNLTQAPVSRRAKTSFFVGGVDEPEPKEDTFTQKPSKQARANFSNGYQDSSSKPVFKKGKLVSKPLPRSSKFHQNRDRVAPYPPRTDKRTGGNTNFTPSAKEGSLLNPSYIQKSQPQESKASDKLHPSWEAKKKQQQISLTAFQGKKITFGDD